MKKSLVALALSLALLLGASPASAQGITIVQLVDLFISLGIIAPDKADAARQAVSSMAETGSTEPAQCYSFDTSFGIGAAGNDVVWLQTFLEREGFTIDDSEQTKGAPYGESTAAAVIKFQQKHGISPLTGYAGPITRAKLNSLYGCSGRPVVSVPLVPTTNIGSTTAVSVTSSLYGKDVIGMVNTYEFSAPGAEYWKLRLDCPSSVKVEIRYPVLPALLGKGDSACGSWFTVEPSAGKLESFKLLIGFKSLTGEAVTIGMTATAYVKDFQEVNKLGGDRDVATLYPIRLDPTPTNPPVSSTQPKISVTTESEPTADFAGIWDNFSSGAGNTNSSPWDWSWKASLTLADQKEVKDIVIVNDKVSGEGWSTSARTDNTLGKKLFPLVVFSTDGNTGVRLQQLNRVYDASMIFGSGTYTLRFYGQKESENFSGSLLIRFTDGTSAKTSIVPPVATPIALPTISTVSPNVATKDQVVRINGSNLIGASSVEFYNSSGALVASATPSLVQSGYVNVALSSASLSAMPAGIYIAKVVTNACKGGCTSNGLGITVQPSVAEFNATISGSLSRTGDMVLNDTTRLSWSTTGDTTGLNISIDLENTATGVKTNYANTLSPSLGGYDVKLIPGFVYAGQSYKVNVNIYKAGIGLINSATAGTFKAVNQPVASSATLTTQTISSTEDYAGVWDNFGAGAGNINKNPADWKWQATLTLGTDATITSMEVQHDTAGERWSTTNPAYYPLVIGMGGKQVNTGYTKEVVKLTKGTHVLDLYGQRETSTFGGGSLNLVFSDGSSMSARLSKMATSVSSTENQAGILSVGQVLELLRALR